VLCSTVGYKWVTVMDGVKLEFNDIIRIYDYSTSMYLYEKQFWRGTVWQSRIFYY